MVPPSISRRRQSCTGGSVSDGAREALRTLTLSSQDHIPEAFRTHIHNVHFTSSLSSRDMVLFPCPLKEQEAVAAIKALEACAAAAIADLRYGKEPRFIEVDIDKTACFLMSAYISTVDGMDKADPAVKTRLPGMTFNHVNREAEC